MKKNLYPEVNKNIPFISTENVSEEKKKKIIDLTREIKLNVINSNRKDNNKKLFKTYNDFEKFYTNINNISNLNSNEDVYIHV